MAGALLTRSMRKDLVPEGCLQRDARLEEKQRSRGRTKAGYCSKSDKKGYWITASCNMEQLLRQKGVDLVTLFDDKSIDREATLHS